MRFLLRLVTVIYPRQWRLRYGDEFGALLEDLGPGWMDLFDILKGASVMRIAGSPVTALAACAGIGGAVMFLGSLLFPAEFVSGYTIRTKESDPSREELAAAAREVFSQTNLTEIIDRYSLYGGLASGRRDALVRTMMENTRITTIPRPAAGVRVSFAYFDRSKGQAVAGELSRRMALLTGLEFHNSSLVSAKKSPHRWLFIGFGTVLGGVAGLFASSRWRCRIQ